MKKIRLKLKIAYIGTNFSGWQFQPHERTVQGCIETVLKNILKTPISIYGAGRTDAGVHALGQVAHLDIPVAKKHIPWQKALNSQLPDDISILEVDYVDSNFHARYSSVAKIYSYTIWTQSNYILPNKRPFCWKTGPVDLRAMLDAAKLLIGEKDFKCFQNSGTPIKNTVRKIYKIFYTPGTRPEEKIFYFIGNGFLKQMVRNIMGSLYSIGKGKMDISTLSKLIEKKDRTLLPMTAPAKGLCLEQVLY